MRKPLLILGLIILGLLTSCASIPREKMTLAEDLGSPQKIKLLKDRVEEYWNAMVKGDLKTAYSYFDPFYRTKTNPEEFLEKHGLIKYHEFSIVDVKVEGNIGTVKVKVKYSIPKVVIKQKEFSQPETIQEFDERWLFVYDNWYKEYYLRLFESGFVYY